MKPTMTTTTSPVKNHAGLKLPVTCKIMKPTTMMVMKPDSMVICINNAADVALPPGMPRRRASSTTSVAPAMFNDGAMVFMKNVPNTSGSVSFGPIFSLTDANVK